MTAAVRVLSIDGGGIRGIIPASILAEVERRTGRATAELFDLVAGTSTGGIIALGVTRPGADGAPAWRAAGLVELYREEGPRIFARSLWQRLRSGQGILAAKFRPRGLEGALHRYFGDARLAEALTPVLVTAYDIERRQPFFFRSARAASDPTADFAMRDVARATSAAPTYFAPPRLRNEVSGESYALVDGGVFANNPSMCAYAEILARRGRRDVLCMSLGTGQHTRAFPYARARNWGLLGWARPILDVVFDGVSDTIDYELDQLLGAERHVRLQTELTVASDALGDVSPANIARLERQAAELIASSEPELERICAALTQASRERPG